MIGNYNAWMLDNEIYHNEGDGIQVGNGAGHDFYAGRNVAHHNKQAGLHTKRNTNVIFSQNTVYGQRISSSSTGAGMGFQYGPQNVWFLFNHIYDCNRGITVSSNVVYPGQQSFLIGNVIHDIHAKETYPHDGWSTVAIRVSGSPIDWVQYILGNTIYDVDAGIHGDSGSIINNIIANVTNPAGREIYVEGAGAATSVLRNNLFYRGGQPIRISWGGSWVYDLPGFQAAFPGVADGSLQADPLFVDPANGDFHLREVSPAVDAGASLEPYFTLFESQYGVSIAYDFDDVVRPQGLLFDIGAYEVWNHAPTAQDDAAATDEDSPVTTGNVLANDPDPDSDLVSVRRFTQPAHGTVVYNGDGTFTYTPAAHFNGTDSFAYTADDGRDGEDGAVVAVTVNPVNDKPVAEAQAQFSGIDTPLVLDLGVTDVETAYADLTFNVPARSQHGSLTETGHGIYTYTPDAGYRGADSFTFTVTDTGDPVGTPGDTLTGDPATVSLSVYRKQHFTGKTKAQYLDANGNKVTVSLSGPGSGDLYFVSDGGLGSASGDGYLVAAEPPADARALVLDGTTAASRVTITTAPSKRTTVQDIIINGALASLTGRTTDLTGDITARGAVPQITLGDVKGPSEVRLNTRGAVLARPPQLSTTFRDVDDCSIDTGGLAIRSLRAARWLNTDGVADSIQAPGLNMLMILGRTIYAKGKITRIAGDFEAGLSLTGVLPARRPAVTYAWISGKLAGAAWDVGGNVGTLRVGSVGDDFAGDFAGAIGSLSTVGNLSGGWTAPSIRSVRVGDSIVGAALTLTQAAAPKSLAMALGYMSVRRWIDASSVESAGTIGSLTAGAIRDSDVFAGVGQTRDLNGDGRADMPDPDTDFDVLALAAIKTVTINGIRGEEFAVARSNIAAANLGRIAIGNVDGDNSGEAFGVAGKRLGGLRCASALTTPASWPNLPSLGDFRVAVV
jgi:hypothetical protein